MEFQLTQEFIELNKLLKIMNLVDSGGFANRVITEEEVRVNGEITTLKRKKIRKGEIVEFNNQKITIT